MGRSLFLLILIASCFLMLLPPPASAASPGEEGGSCCSSGFSFVNNSCINNQIPAWCSSIVSDVVINFMGTPLCSLTTPFLIRPYCAQITTQFAAPAASSCVDFVAASASFGSITSAGLCGNLLNRFEPLVNGIPILGPLLTQFTNSFQSSCQTAVNGLLSSLPATPFMTPQCNLGLNCVSGICTPPITPPPPKPGPDIYCGAGSSPNVKTALGCLPVDARPLVTEIARWSVGIGGGIALLVIVFAGFQVSTAAGDTKKVAAAKELVSAALTGLFLLSLSIVLLNFIGVKILGLDLFGFNV